MESMASVDNGSIIGSTRTFKVPRAADSIIDFVFVVLVVVVVVFENQGRLRFCRSNDDDDDECWVEDRGAGERALSLLGMGWINSNTTVLLSL